MRSLLARSLSLVGALFLGAGLLVAMPVKGPGAAALHAAFTADDPDRVFVVAHRADWRHFPENSLAAIESCIALGVPMVETDVRRTKDGGLVLMHDRTVDRTTTGQGRVEDLTLAEIRALYLRDGLGMPTEFRVPTLREALEVVRGRILVNLDKSYELVGEIMPLLEETGTRDQVLFKGTVTRAEARARHGEKLDQVLFMPIVRLNEPDGLARTREWLAVNPPPAIEFVFAEWTPAVDEALALCRSSGVRIWIDTLWPHLSGGFSDDRALRDPSAIYGTLRQRGVSVFQTDRPRELMSYLAREAGAGR